MKKVLLALCLGFLAFSCEKNPDFDKIEAEPVVYSDYDKEADFASYKTYFLPDSILEIKAHKAEFWKDVNAQQIIKEVAQEMNQRGYVRITDAKDKGTADVGIQLSYITETNVVWDGGYYGWWDYYYWGAWWGGWYYPYTIAYAYNTNTLIMEMVDLTNKPAEGDKRPLQSIPVVWYSQIDGYQYSGLYNTQFLVSGVDQAFRQSPYINSGK